jgi:hypothetical protein
LSNTSTACDSEPKALNSGLAGDALVHVVADGLREVHLQPRHLAVRAVELLDQGAQIGRVLGPVGRGLELDEQLEVVGELGVGAVFRATELTHRALG